MPPRRIGDSGRNRNFRIEDELYDPALARAEAEGRTLTWVVRHALQLYLAGRLPLPGHDESPPPAQGTGSTGNQN